MDASADSTADQSRYTVIARRYRPRSFAELAGQDHVSQALSKAIQSGRVGHAYLFAGARGVGKTSTARIFAKALCLREGISQELADEISSAIDAGSDMDVIEIDGASNRGIDEIRQLRSNVNIRPSRAPYKIYIIDEVHMLTDAAFNALLKTLEEPPEHVKFIFCTTNPDKMPITVLSRCQRFDFVPVKFETIQQRLADIAKSEGFEVEPEALMLLARRASGSMRDSQSLLEQVASFASGTITVALVHSMLGTADEGCLLGIAQALRDHDPLAAIAAVHRAADGGTDVGQLAEQLLGYLRDLLTTGIGGSPQLLKFANPAGHADLKLLADAWGVQSILSAIQILDEAIARMRASVSASTLLEVALIQISQLEHLTSIPALLEALGSSQTGPAQQKKKLTQTNVEPFKQQTPATNTSHAASKSQEHDKPQNASFGSVDPTPQEQGRAGQPLASKISATPSVENPNTNLERTGPIDPTSQWKLATRGIEGLLADFCQLAETVEPMADGTWKVIFPAGCGSARDYCNQPDHKLELISTLTSQLGREIRLHFDVKPGQAAQIEQPAITSSAHRLQSMREVAENPLVKQIIEVLDGEIVRIHPAHAAQAKPIDTSEPPTRSATINSDGSHI